MIDHLFTAASEAAALALPALARFIVQTENGPAFDESRVFRNITAVTARATHDGEGNMLTPQTRLPGYFFAISINGNTPDAALCAAPGHMLAAHREMAIAGLPYIFQQGFGANPAVLATVVALDGVPTGSDYPFGQAAIIT